ncbi:hypothetical protein DSUL_20331 [Desulfovibrionales bacterium]
MVTLTKFLPGMDVMVDAVGDMAGRQVHADGDCPFLVDPWLSSYSWL